MRTVDIIAKKRDGQALTEDEINWFIRAYTDEDIPDYQVAAWLMAVYFNGMTPQETTALTMAIAQSGDMLDLSSITDYAVDKHSSGGVGDKTSLVVLPLVAACGVPIAKMSGRGLGHTGGTLDKIESIPGYNVALNEDDFLRLAKEQGMVLAGQTRDLAPADGKLYALRDVTATVASLPLIASSIMSKKIAAGAKGIVLDVKAGNGAFMTDVESAVVLAELMVKIGQNAGRDMVALISDMNEPLGQAVGNALEVKEAINTLKGEGPPEFREHCLVVAGHMLRLAGRGEKWVTLDDAIAHLTQKLDNSDGLARFRQMIAAQGGDPDYVDNPAKLPQAQFVETITADQSGYIAQVAANHIASSALILGAGREKKGDPVDLAVGVVVHVRVGDAIQHNAPLATIHANDENKLNVAKSYIERAITYSDTPVEPLPLFYQTINGD